MQVNLVTLVRREIVFVFDSPLSFFRRELERHGISEFPRAAWRHDLGSKDEEPFEETESNRLSDVYHTDGCVKRAETYRRDAKI